MTINKTCYRNFINYQIAFVVMWPTITLLFFFLFRWKRSFWLVCQWAACTFQLPCRTSRSIPLSWWQFLKANVPSKICSAWATSYARSWISNATTTHSPCWTTWICFWRFSILSLLKCRLNRCFTPSSRFVTIFYRFWYSNVL